MIKFEGKNRGGEGTTPVTTACLSRSWKVGVCVKKRMKKEEGVSLCFVDYFHFTGFEPPEVEWLCTREGEKNITLLGVGVFVGAA